MDITYYKQYEPIFGVWHITRLIGEGSFGKVFELEREDFGVKYKAALKAITIPASQSEVDDLMAEMTDEASVKTYYSTFVKELVEESALMSRLKGNSNIVSYENHQVIEHKEGVGWDVLIQMELLTPLNRYLKEHTVTRQDVIKLGIDLCKGLELCQKFNIIHRDIKPENIFVSDAGDFKLGDFGIARTIEKTTGGLSKKGTYNYMAPEVYKGEPYGSTVDIYSLGIVLYRLLNENRTPFLPAYPAPITHRDRENALAKRFGGAPLPMPVNGTGRLGEIVLKACAYESKDRYSSPAQMRQELEAILYNREEAPYIYPEGDQVEQKSVEYAKTGDEDPVAHYDATSRDDATGGGTVSDFGGAASSSASSDSTYRLGKNGLTDSVYRTSRTPAGQPEMTGRASASAGYSAQRTTQSSRTQTGQRRYTPPPKPAKPSHGLWVGGGVALVLLLAVVFGVSHFFGDKQDAGSKPQSSAGLSQDVTLYSNSQDNANSIIVPEDHPVMESSDSPFMDNSSPEPEPETEPEPEAEPEPETEPEQTSNAQYDSQTDQLWESVWDRIETDLSSKEFNYSQLDMTPMEYAAYLKQNRFSFADENYEDVSDPAYVKPGRIWAIPITEVNLNAINSVWITAADDHSEAIGSIRFGLYNAMDQKFNVDYYIAALNIVEKVAPMPCGIQLGDSFHTMIEKLGITGDMLDWSAGEVELETDRWLINFKQSRVEGSDPSVLNELSLYDKAGIPGNLLGISICSGHTDSGRETIDFSLYYV